MLGDLKLILSSSENIANNIDSITNNSSRDKEYKRVLERLEKINKIFWAVMAVEFIVEISSKTLISMPILPIYLVMTVFEVLFFLSLEDKIKDISTRAFQNEMNDRLLAQSNTSILED